jgi:CRP/FNR family transcriptional regulator, nitrogen fixation regulation protein
MEQIKECTMQIAKQKMLVPDNASSASNTRRAASDAFSEMEQFGCTVIIRRTHEIYRHDDPTDFCWRILSGCARNVNVMEDGRRQITEFGWPGDLIGIDDHGTYYSDAEAVTDVTLRRYPRQVIETHVKSSVALALWLRMNTVDHLRHIHGRMILLARKTAVERIASFLLEMERRGSGTNGGLVELPMSRTDIADHLGLSIETVCRNLVSLQREGTVAIRRSGIELLDRALLLELACE